MNILTIFPFLAFFVNLTLGCFIIYVNPKGEQIIFPRASDKHPKQPDEIKPHPYGVELGILIKMLAWTEQKTIKAFLLKEFSSVGGKSVDEILEKSFIPSKTKPSRVTRDMAEKMIAEGALELLKSAEENAFKDEMPQRL